MRGSDMRTGELFSYVDIEDRVPSNHPLRLIRRIVNDVLAATRGGLRQARTSESVGKEDVTSRRSGADHGRGMANSSIARARTGRPRGGFWPSSQSHAKVAPTVVSVGP